MIDIGVNLTNRQFANDKDAVILRAKEAGVTGIVLTGTNCESSAMAADLAALYPQFAYSTAGVHPHDAIEVDDLSLSIIRDLAAQPQVVAIGECGLDFNRDFSPRLRQEEVFEAQLQLAVELNMPVFLHCRDAHQRFIEILTPWLSKLPGAVLHCFTGSKIELEQCLALGLYIGITGWICDERRGQELRSIVSLIPDDKIMLETDAPFLLPRTLSPKPKSRRNEPCYLFDIAREVAALRQQNVEQLIVKSTENSHRFFSF